VIRIFVQIWTLVFIFSLLVSHKPAYSSEILEEDISVRVDVWIGKNMKLEKNKIESRLKGPNVRKVDLQIARWGSATQTVGIGNRVPVRTAQRCLQIASEINGVLFLLSQFLVPDTYVTIGSSLYEEKLEIPITQKNLKRLLDPELNHSEFHSLYQRLTGEDKVYQSLQNRYQSKE